MAGKRIHEIKMSIDDALLLELTRLAMAEDRKLSDLVHVIVLKYVFGHVPRIDEDFEVRRREICGL